jgi:transposase InsO family protein
VEPACAVLELSPSTYYAARKREESPSARGERDEEMRKAIARARERRGRQLYGARKMWRELNRDGTGVARCTVERLMREMGLEGLRARKKRPRTTVPGPAGQERPSDLLERDFTAPAPNRRWVADIQGYSGGDARLVTNFRLAARLRERRPASRKDWVTTLSPRETGRACIIPPDSPKTRSSTCAR